MITLRAIPASAGSRLRLKWRERMGLLVAATLGLAGIARAESSREYQVKAAFLYNFAKFVEWPADRFSADDAPLIIGVLGRNPFGDELEKTVRDRTVNGHRIVVIYLQASANAKSLPIQCHVLFVGAGDEALFARLAPRAAAGAMLTVGESTAFAAAGIVTFVVADDKVRFEIDADAADSSQLKISAQLLKLASVVRKKS